VAVVVDLVEHGGLLALVEGGGEGDSGGELGTVGSRGSGGKVVLERSTRGRGRGRCRNAPRGVKSLAVWRQAGRRQVSARDGGAAGGKGHGRPIRDGGLVVALGHVAASRRGEGETGSTSVRGSVITVTLDGAGGEGGGFTGSNSARAVGGARRVSRHSLREDRGVVTGENTDGGKGTMSVPRGVSRGIDGGAGRDGNCFWSGAVRAGEGARHAGVA